MQRPRITYYPRIDDAALLRDQVMRAAWYLPPTDPELITIHSSIGLDTLANLQDFDPQAARFFDDHPALLRLESASPSLEQLREADIVICWKGLQALRDEFGQGAVQRLRKAGVAVFNVDYTERMEDS